MAPSAPSKAPLVLCVCSHNGFIFYVAPDGSQVHMAPLIVNMELYFGFQVASIGIIWCPRGATLDPVLFDGATMAPEKEPFAP